MIKVIEGKVETQEEKPFPKLMSDKGGSIVLVFSKNDEYPTGDRYNVLKIKGFGDFDYTYSDSFCLFSLYNPFTDFNEPITIQNA